MTTIAYSAKFRRQRRFLLIAPAGAVVLLTILFAALGGGKEKTGKSVIASTKGINVTLPLAHLKADKGIDKIAYYKQAELDSLAAREREKRQVLVSGQATDTGRAIRTVVDVNEEKIRQQIVEVRKAMAVRGTYRAGGNAYPTEKREPAIASPDIDRLEKMLFAMRETGKNPEVQELNKTLAGLLALEHPGRASDTGAAKLLDLTGVKALVVQPAVAAEAITSWKVENTARNRFYELDTSGPEEHLELSAIDAIVPETQTLVNGALMKLELGTDLVIKGHRIVQGTLLYGVAHVNGERLMVTINSIRFQEQVYPVTLQVVDQDGLPGIYEPGSINRDVARESAGESIGGLGPGTLDPSLGAQVASGAIQMARSLAGKKMRLVRVTVKSGYRVFLKDLSVTASR